MNDQELLTYAAKAAHIEADIIPYGDEIFSYYAESGTTWNPLKSDSDAIQLACRISYIHRSPFSINIESQNDGEQGYSLCDGVNFEATQHHKKHSMHEICLATRRAIVMAAAEIGKGM